MACRCFSKSQIYQLQRKYEPECDGVLMDFSLSKSILLGIRNDLRRVRIFPRFIVCFRITTKSNFECLYDGYHILIFFFSCSSFSCLLSSVLKSFYVRFMRSLTKELNSEDFLLDNRCWVHFFILFFA